MRRGTDMVLLAVLLIHALGMVWWAGSRPVDGDEGYYAGAAREIAAGKVPYVDFFYPQAPLLPYLYAPFTGLAAGSLVGLRLVSVAAASLGLLLWSAYLRRREGIGPALALAGAAVLALDPGLWSWQATVKTYAAVNLLVLAGLFALDRTRSRGTASWWPAAAGLAAGLAAGTRALYLPWAVGLGLAQAVWAPGREDGARGARPAGGLKYGAGLAAGLVPMALFFLRDRDRFLFDNLGYHLLRYSPHDEPGSGPADRILDAVTVLGRALQENPFLLVVLALAVGGVFGKGRRREPLARPWAAAAGIHILVCLLPDPVYEQYFTAALGPLLAPLAWLGLQDLRDRIRGPAARLALPLGAAALMGLLCWHGLKIGKTGIDTDRVWRLDHQARVAEAIGRHSEPGDVVMAYWSGYPFISGREYLPGMENHFALGVSEQLTLEEQTFYRIAGKEYILEAEISRAPVLVVLGGWMHEVNTRLEQRHIPVLLDELDRNYEIVETLDKVKILARRQVPLAPGR